MIGTPCGITNFEYDIRNDKMYSERAQCLTQCDQIFLMTAVFRETKFICWRKSLKLFHSEHNSNNNDTNNKNNKTS